ncbi:UNVERIFIED_CONTAM: hypothetical protein K2H54_020410 [Gekko kuhli]
MWRRAGRLGSRGASPRLLPKSPGRGEAEATMKDYRLASDGKMIHYNPPAGAQAMGSGLKYNSKKEISLTRAEYSMQPFTRLCDPENAKGGCWSGVRGLFEEVAATAAKVIYHQSLKSQLVQPFTSLDWQLEEGIQAIILKRLDLSPFALATELFFIPNEEKGILFWEPGC